MRFLVTLFIVAGLCSSCEKLDFGCRKPVTCVEPVEEPNPVAISEIAEPDEVALLEDEVTLEAEKH